MRKMSQAEFQRCAAYALELRQRALNGDLDSEEYRAEIRE